MVASRNDGCFLRLQACGFKLHLINTYSSVLVNQVKRMRVCMSGCKTSKFFIKTRLTGKKKFHKTKKHFVYKYKKARGTSNVSVKKDRYWFTDVVLTYLS